MRARFGKCSCLHANFTNLLHTFCMLHICILLYLQCDTRTTPTSPKWQEKFGERQPRWYKNQKHFKCEYKMKTNTHAKLKGKNRACSLSLSRCFCRNLETHPKRGRNARKACARRDGIQLKSVPCICAVCCGRAMERDKRLHASAR